MAAQPATSSTPVACARSAPLAVRSWQGLQASWGYESIALGGTRLARHCTHPQELALHGKSMARQ